MVKEFNLKYFKRLSLTSKEKAFDYALDRLKWIGGSTRDVFEFNSKYVLKLDMECKQNCHEIMVSESYDMRDHIFTRVIDYDKHNYFWLIAEKAKPLKSYKQFKELAGISINDIVAIEYNHSNKNKLLKKSSLLKKVYYLNNKFNVADLCCKENWGIFNGKPIIIDYGYYEENIS